MKNNTAFCSWSGGKDSCLSLYRAMQQGIRVEYLFTMFTEDGQRSRGHGIRPEIIQKQAELLNMKFIYGQATWDNYEEVFKTKMLELEGRGVNIGVFGDIDLEKHRQWVIGACKHTSIKVVLPLWQNQRRDIIEAFIDLGFKGIITTVNNDVLANEYLGVEFNKSLIEEFEQQGIDACGENGEFHTIVVDGPIFQEPLRLQYKEPLKVQNYSMLDLDLL